MKRFSKIMGFFLATVLCFGTMSALVGCGGNTVDIVTYTMFGDGDSHQEAWQEVLAKYDGQKVSVIDEAGETIEVKVSVEDRSKWSNEYSQDVAKDLAGTSPSDLVYGFYGPGIADYASKLASVEDIRGALTEIDSSLNYGTKGIVDTYAGDTLHWKYGYQMGFIYNSDYYAPTDFESIDSLETKLAANVGTDGEAADFGGEPNTIFQMYALHYLGDAIAECSDSITKTWWEDNKTALVNAIEGTLNYAKAAGFSGNPTVDREAEVEKMSNGEGGLILNGSWGFGLALGGSADAKMEFAAMPDTSKYVFSDYSHGWQLTKTAIEDPIKAQVLAQIVNDCYTESAEFAKAGNGVYLNAGEGNSDGPTGDAVASLDGKIAVKPIEDRLHDTAKPALYVNGINSAIEELSSLTDFAAKALTIYEAVLATF